VENNIAYAEINQALRINKVRSIAYQAKADWLKQGKVASTWRATSSQMKA